MADFKIDERTKLGVNMPMRVWLGGIFAFSSSIITTVAVGVGGWYALQTRFERLESRMITRETLEVFTDRLLKQLPTIEAATESRVRLSALEERVKALEQRP